MTDIAMTRIVTAVMIGMALLAAGMSPMSVASAATVEAHAAQGCTNLAQFIRDVTIPDNTILRPGQAFTKTWRLRNTGTCAWSTSYKLVHDSGATLGGAASVRLAQAVARNGSVDISVPLAAPSAPGTYSGFWRLADASGQRFGPLIRVVIVVPATSGGGELPDTLSVLYGGGDGFACPELATRSRRPAITVQGAEGLWPRHAMVCVYGMPPRSQVTVTARGPDGALHAAPFYVAASTTQPETQGAPVLVLLHWPDNQPNGTWVLGADAGQLHAETTVIIRDDPVDGQELRIVPLGPFFLFDTVLAGPQEHTHSYAAGESIELRGYRYVANAQIPLGIYRDEPGYAPGGGAASALVDTLSVRTDAAGDFRQAYRIPATSRPGRYRVLVAPTDRGGDSPEADAVTWAFYVRAAPDTPLPGGIRVDQYPDGLVVMASNLGRVSTRGGSITISSPDVIDLTIVEADVPIRPAGYTNCAVADAQAWVLGPRTPCSKALQYGTNCRRLINLSYPMAEAWYKPWPANQTNWLKVRWTPKAGVRQVRLYVRTAMLAGASGCRMEIAPTADEADASDQQGFPVTVQPVPEIGQD
jgi:hypothetical protein